MRAAILSAMMSLTPIAPIDLLRFLNVPAIVMTLRSHRGRACADRECDPRTRRRRMR
jgi:hypothetical protein